MSPSPLSRKPSFQQQLFSLALLALIGFWFLPAGVKGSEPFPSEAIDFFEKRVRPVLEDHCFECHAQRASKIKGGLLLDTRGSLLKGGESGAVVNLNQPSESLLLKAIHYDDVDLQMPPESRLSDGQIRDLVKWVEIGLPWPNSAARTESSPDKEPFDLEKRRREHWAWRPLEKVTPPELDSDPWGQQPIDAFLLQSMRSQKLEPASEVSARVWFRRLHVVLTGIPPSPASMDAFLSDKDPDARSKAVDQILESKHYGEHWARHWLDLMRYAETMGHEFDYEIPNAWRYRDYVIRAFNQDLPYNEFVMEHLAGDQLSKPRLDASTGLEESVIGTGFFWLGQQVHSPVDIQMNQLDVLDNQIDVVSKAFLGLTVSCARCHDHKFDAISTRDYYGMFGVMKSSRYQQTTLMSDERWTSGLNTWQDLQERGRKVLDASEHDLDDLAARWQPNPGEVLLGDARQDGFAGWYFDDEALQYDPIVEPGDMVDRPGEGEPVPVKATAVDSAKWSRHLQGSLRSPTFLIDQPFLHTRAAGHQARINVVIDNFNLIRGPIYDGIKKNLDRNEVGWTTFNLTMWQGHEAYIEFKDTIHADLSNGGAHGPEAWFSVETVIASSQAEPPKISSASVVTPEASLPDAWLELARAYRELGAQVDVSPTGLSMIEGSGRDNPIYIRGNPRRRGEIANRGILTSMAHLATPIEGSGRLALAQSMVDPSNPLTARVYVNRIWHHVFGRGIVPSVDDFGVLGQAPTHPKLLDWLARWFMEEAKWSTKELIRMLVRSRAFSMDSVALDPSMDDQDPQNQYWHRSEVRRLEGESIRDHLLCVSGQLDPRAFGPSEKIHLTPFMTGRGRPGKSGPLDGGRRRSIYVEVRRNFLSPFLSTFDTPIPHTTFGRRAESNVPAQSLVMMNDPFVLQQAEAWAGEILGQDLGLAARLTQMYEKAFCRLPTAQEIKAARDFVADQEAHYLVTGLDREAAQQMTWRDLCHTLFNMKEFIFIR